MPLLNGRNLKGHEAAKFSEALRDAFKSPPQLEMMLGQGMTLNLWNYVPWSAEFDVVVYKLIENLQSDGKTADLLVAARLAKPGNVELYQFAQTFGLTSLPTTPDFFESVVKPKLGFLDFRAFVKNLADVEGRIARVAVETSSGTKYGTGFLVGPDALLTNYHVVMAAIDAKLAGDTVAGQAVSILFDDKVMANNTKVCDGTPYKLASGDRWLIDHSPYSAMDGKPDPTSGAPDSSELDYALLRLAESAALDPVGGERFAGPGGTSRGFVKIGDGGHDQDYAAGRPLFIVQHPDGGSLKLALDTEGMIGPNSNKTRVRYKVNTLGGSSGSPCFNADFQVIALHHSGDPRTKASAEYNEGIPLRAIRALLKSRRKDGELG
jgi:V8-like Glu-specific endopeptidase